MDVYGEAVRLQLELAGKVSVKDFVQHIHTVCAVDVAYRNGTANASAIIMDAETLELLEAVTYKTKIVAPYIPGLMMLRESGPVMGALRRLENDFDVLLVDGNGQLHPRKCGLACYVGILTDKPTVGVAKSLLCGIIRKKSVEFEGKVLAKIIEKKKGKKIFVSVGNKIRLKAATKLVESLIKKGDWLPMPLKIADKYSKEWDL